MSTKESRWRRRAGLVCLALAPLLLTAATAADPALGDGDWATAVGADPDAAVLHTVLLHWAWVLYVPGLLTLLGPVRRRGAALAAIAWPAIVLGLVTFAGLVLVDVTAVAVASVDGTAFAAFDERVASYGWLTGGWQLPGMAGWALSLVLTPVAAARARVVGWWYAGLALAGAALYFLFAIEPVPLSLTGPLLLSATNAVLAVRLWHAGELEATRADDLARDIDGPTPGGDGRAGGTGGFADFRRRAGAACLVAAPVALAIGMATMPGGAFHLDSFASDPGAAQASAFFLHLSWLLFIPGILALMARVSGRGGMFLQIAGAVAVIGLLHWNGLMVGDYLSLAAEQSLDADDLAAVTELAEGSALVALTVMLPGMLGALVGLVLAPVAAARAGLVRWPVPVLAGLGVLAFFALTTGRVTGLVAPILLLAAYGQLARAVVTMPAIAPAAPEAVPA